MSGLARLSFAHVVLVLLCAGPTAAQSPAPRKVCYQAAPLSRCSLSLVTEFGGGLRLAASQPDSRSSLFQWNLGAVKNVAPGAGIGAAAFFTWSESAYTIGIAPRFRYWATPVLSFDVAPGLIVFQGGSRNLGFNGTLSANYGPHVSATTTVQVTNTGVFEHGRQLRQVEWYAGVRLNGKVGTVSGIAAPILTFLGYLILYSRFSD